MVKAHRREGAQGGQFSKLLRYEAQQTEFFVILDHFLLFYCLKDPENQNFGRMKKISEDIILQMCTINDSHMMYSS